MKRSFSLLLSLTLLAFLYAGCDSVDEGDEGVVDSEDGMVTLQGQVLNYATNNPVEGAFVRVLPFDLLYETDVEGRFEADVEIDSTMNITVRATKDGFTGGATTVLAVAGRTVTVPTFRLQQLGEDAPTSGPASNVLLSGQSAETIGVIESGSEEVASLTFQVTDSLGRPVTLDNAVEMSFSFGAAPGGGEFLSPQLVRTDNNGRATVNLSSGTQAGVVQIVAQTSVGGRTIRSLPVSVTIHGGLPDQEHFSVGPTAYNFPGLRTFGLTNGINVIVGDQHSNPVKTGTSVYFSTTHGVIGGSTRTDAAGTGGTTLRSANPLPADGLAIVTATTADRNQNPVVGQAPIVFSGLTDVTVEPQTAILGQTYTLTVQDQNGNPLAPGTAIAVEVEGTKVKAVGNTEVELDDTAFRAGALADGALTPEDVITGPGITQFTFSAVADETLDEGGTSTVETITISISSPNGNIELVLTDEGATTRTEGAQLELHGQAAHARLVD